MLHHCLVVYSSEAVVRFVHAYDCTIIAEPTLRNTSRSSCLYCTCIAAAVIPHALGYNLHYTSTGHGELRRKSSFKFDTVANDGSLSV